MPASREEGHHDSGRLGILFHSLISMHVRTPRSSILSPASIILLLCLYGAGALAVHLLSCRVL
jgi:hypothetical protein